MPNVSYNPFIVSISGTIQGATFGKNGVLSSKGGRASNKKKKSPAQLLNIAKTNVYRTAWNNLTVSQKRAWSAAGALESNILRLPKGKKLTGHNLFIKCCFNACIRGATPLSNYVAPSFYPIPSNPCGNYTLATGVMRCSGFVSMPTTVFMNISASRPLYIVPSIINNLLRLVYPPALGFATDFELGAYYRAIFGTPPSVGYYIIIRTFFIDSLSGFASAPCFQIVNVV
jgi:hypothetical protein